MRFDNKTVLVTGATSGIGRAAARAFAAAGAKVALSGRDRGRGSKARDSIAETGGQAAFFAEELTSPGAGSRLVERTLDAFGSIDVLVNNAGIIHRATAEDTTDDQWLETFAVNVHAVFYLSRAVLPAMRAAGGGAIVNVASDAALIGAPRMAAYCASKGAVLQLTRAMALDCASDGIRINAVCPDNVDTPMLTGEALQLGENPERYLRDSAQAIPLGRVAKPEEVADAILFLASARAAFLTGVGLPVDGGYTAQ
jgi:NAD(P)-dependent dehydrogenase (short-subunit alcohol dehydrogenase family)